MGVHQNIDPSAIAASALDWWREAGLDALVDESPRHWLREQPAADAPARPADERVAAPIVAPAVPVQIGRAHV